MFLTTEHSLSPIQLFWVWKVWVSVMAQWVKLAKPCLTTRAVSVGLTCGRRQQTPARGLISTCDTYTYSTPNTHIQQKKTSNHNDYKTCPQAFELSVILGNYQKPGGGLYYDLYMKYTHKISCTEGLHPRTVEFRVGWERCLDLEGSGSIKDWCIYEFPAQCVCRKDLASLLLIYHLLSKSCEKGTWTF